MTTSEMVVPARPAPVAASDSGGSAARWRLGALAGGGALLALGMGLLPMPKDGAVGFPYDSLADQRGQFYAASMLAAVGAVVTIVGLPRLRSYATGRGGPLAQLGLGLAAASLAASALFAAAFGVSMTWATAGQLDSATGTAYVEAAQRHMAPILPYLISSIALGIVGWVMFAIGARRSRTLGTWAMLGFIVVAVVTMAAPPGPIGGGATAVFAAVLVYLASRTMRDA